ncbi:hypothetical protein J4450_04725 [Candidatus Micrarchaeota archaeon]|nr:hypothetical protein [Candidatus Micrarchaeota archaeon]
MGASALSGLDVRSRIRQAETLTIPESCSVLTEGFMGFQSRDRPSSLSGVSFIRIAGQAVGLDNENSRTEIRRMLDKIKPNGVFLVLGHGGIFPCGAVAAKKAALELATRGELLQEHPLVLELVKHVSEDVAGRGSPTAEFMNACYQARKILRDDEFNEIIRRKNLTVTAVIMADDKPLSYVVLNKEWGFDELFRNHPKLVKLSAQMAKGLRKIIKKGIDISSHYAHAIFVYDPFRIRTILDPREELLDVGGISCVDARLKPNTPDCPKHLFKLDPNESFAVTVELNGSVNFSFDDLGSIIYALHHVKGVNSLSRNGNAGNGHIVCLDTSIDAAVAIKLALLGEDAIRTGTIEGRTITTAAFNGKRLLIDNKEHGIEINLEYSPRVDILTA